MRNSNDNFAGSVLSLARKRWMKDGKFSKSSAIDGLSGWAVLVDPSRLHPFSPVRKPAAFAQSRTVPIRCLTRRAVTALVSQIGARTLSTCEVYDLVNPSVRRYGERHTCSAC